MPAKPLAVKLRRHPEPDDAQSRHLDLPGEKSSHAASFPKQRNALGWQQEEALSEDLLSA